MSKKNLYNKLLKEKKIADKYNVPRDKIVIKKSNTFLKLLSFFSAIFSKFFKVIAYILIIALCSIGATYLLNNIIKIKIF